MKTREEFVRQWRYRLAGLALFGTASDVKDGTLKRATRALEIPEEVERLLGAMWDDVTKEPPKPLSGSNGQHAKAVPARSPG